MKKVNWKGTIASLGICGVVLGGSYYLNYINDISTVDQTTKAIHDRTEQDLKNITVNAADINSDDNSPFVDDSSMQDKPKQDPQIGDTISDVDNSTWGRAGDVTTTKTAFGESQFWIYQNGRSILFDNGKVVSITQ